MASPRASPGLVLLAEVGRGAERLEYFGNGDFTAFVLEILHDRQQRPGGGARAVQCVHELQVALAAEPYIQATRLIVRLHRPRFGLPPQEAR